MHRNMIILYFRLPYFHVSNVALFSTSLFSIFQDLQRIFLLIKEGPCIQMHSMFICSKSEK